MGYRELLEALGREVGDEKQKMLAEAQRRGQKILDEASREVERHEQSFSAEDFREALLEREKLLAGVTQRQSLASLSARREAVEAVRSQVGERLAALRTKPSYRKLMETLMEEVLREMPDVATWQVDPRDVPLVQQIIRERKLPASQVSAGATVFGGVTALSKDSRAKVLNTFEARLAKAWSGLETAIGAHLTGELPSGG